MTETTQTHSLGEQLKNARQALNLSLVEVAEQTNLKIAHLESLEDDIFILPNVPPAFVRGYVRSYVRFLRLPEELVNSANYGEVTIPKQVTKVAAMPVKNSQKSQTRWVKNLTWLILLGAIGMTLTWWWQEYKKDQMSNQQLVSTQVEPLTANSNSVPVVVQTEPAQMETTNSVAVNIQTAETANTATIQPVAVEEPKQEPVVVETVQTPVETPKAEEQSAPAIEVQQPVQPAQEVVVQMPVQQEVPQVVEVAEPVNVLQQTAEPEQPKVEETAETQQIVGDAELRIEITKAQSWITVRGEKNKKLAEKLYSEGEVLTFSDNAQYRLTVGAPANVKIYYKGELVPLKVDGRVARFKLPLAN